jgi:midasin
MRKAVQLVGRLARRLQVLAEEWPEQMVLQHLSDRCAVIFSMNLNSPIVRVIAALEGLLLHTADWESYANRDNSLKSFQSEITDLIIVWRRLELSCWAQLLQTQAVAFSDGASVWWFRLYEVLVPGARAALNEDRQSGTSTAVDNHALGVIALLDKFVSSSPLGQFSARLRLLRSFSRYLSLLSSTSADYPELERLSRILASMSERYALVESSVLGSLDSQRAKLETNIRDFIKLASWKDVNVHALKSSAQHTHRQLHRCIRKFRAILRQPCLPLLSSPEAQHAASVEIPHSDAESIATFARAFLDALPPPPFTPTSTPLQNLPSTFAKFQKLLVSLRSELAHQYSSALNDLAVEIITTSKELAEETPGTLNEDNAKAVKALLSRKKRAWGELLKELKRIGFSNNVRPDILARQHSLPALHSLALLPRNPPLPELAVQAVNKIEGYHFRLLVTMPELRESLRTHHEDLSTRELQRGIGFVESALSVAIEGRTR